MQELKSLIPATFGPETHGQIFLRVRYCCQFEGNGEASETWEPNWWIELPEVPYFWWSTSGWKRGKEGTWGMDFNARTWEGVKGKTVAFLKWYQTERKTSLEVSQR